MTIVAIVGKPGTGKSYEACVVMKKAALEKRPIITNLPINDKASLWREFRASGRLLQLPHDRGDLNRLAEGLPHAFCHPAAWEIARDVQPVALVVRTRWTVRLWRAMKWRVRKSRVHRTVRGSRMDRRWNGTRTMAGTVLVIDEAGVCFTQLQQRAAKTDYAARIMKVLMEHRHSLMDIYLLTQNHTLLPLEIKHLVHQWRELISLEDVGLVGGYTAKTYAHWFGSREPLQSSVRRYNTDIFELYDSHALGTGAGEGQGREHKTGFGRLPLWLKPGMIMIYVAAGGLLYFVPDGYRSVAGIIGGEDVATVGLGEKDEEVVQTIEAPVEGETGDEPLAEGEYIGPPAPIGMLRHPRMRSVIGIDLFGEPDTVYLPPIEVAVVGMIGDVVIWADGTTLSQAELAAMGVMVSDVRMCSVTLSGSGYRVRWICPTPGG